MSIENGVHQLGVVTPGNAVVWVQNNLVKDGGGPPLPPGPQTANFVFAGPPNGAPAIPAFRHLVAEDINGISGITLPNLNTPLLYLGGTTSAFASLQGVGARADFLLADGSAYAPVRALNFTAQSPGGQFYGPSGTFLSAVSDGVWRFSNAAGTDFSLLEFGGGSAAFPALKRVATGLAARLADDSGDAPFSAAASTFSGDATPKTNLLYSLGTSLLRWLKLWAVDGDFSGNVNIGGNLNVTGTITSPAIANPNKVINGNCEVDQRRSYVATTIGPAAANGDYICDRFLGYARSLANNISADIQCFQAGPPYPYVLRYSVNTATQPVDPTDYTGIQYCIEGYDLADALWGTASAKPITISFAVNNNVIGTYGIALQNAANDRYFIGTYTVNAPGVWETKTVTIPGDTGGTWLIQNQRGVRIWFDLGCGATQSRAATVAWQAIAPTFIAGLLGGQKIWGAAGNRVYFANIKIENGGAATAFVPDNFEVSLAKCQRYFWQCTKRTQFTYYGASGMNTSATNALVAVQGAVPMRATPTYSATGTVQIQSGGAGWTIGTIGPNNNSVGPDFLFNVSSPGAPFTTGFGVVLQEGATGGGVIKMDAEL